MLLTNSKFLMVRSFFTMAWAALAVAAVALLKEAVVAKSFGASWELDAFLVSFFVAFFFPALLCTTLQGTFVPSFWEAFKSDPRRGWLLASVTLNMVGLALLVCLGMLLLTWRTLVSFVAPGFGDSARVLSNSLLWVLSPTVILTGINEQLKNTLHALKVFALPSLSQILPSLMAIVIIVLAGGKWGVYAFAYGWNAGLFAQTVILFLCCKKEGGVYSPAVNFFLPEIRGLIARSLTYLFVPLSLLGLLLVDKYFASLLGPGVISYFGYAEKLFRVPWMIIAAALFTTALPYYSEQVSERSIEGLKEVLSLTLRLGAFLTIPIGIGMSVLSRPLVSVLFERGAFTSADASATATVVIGLMMSLFFYAMTFILDRGLCALGQTRVLMKLALITFLLKILSAWLMTKAWGLLGLALSTAPPLALECIAMYLAIRMRIGGLQLPAFCTSLGKIAVASSVMAAVIFTTAHNNVLPVLMTPNHDYGSVAIAFSILTGGIVYWLISLWMGSNEAKILLEILGKRGEVKGSL